MKIKIHTDGHGTPEVEGESTVVPELFVTAAFYGEFGFSSHQFVLTHFPTGIKVGLPCSKDECHRLAKLLSKTTIPWAGIDSPDDAKPYRDQYRSVMDEFERTAR